MAKKNSTLIVFLVIGWVAAVILGGVVIYQALNKPGSPSKTPVANTTTDTTADTAKNTDPLDSATNTTPDTTTNNTPAPVAPAQSLHTPATGSAERKAIMDAMRPEIEAYLGQKVVFKVDVLKVKSNYAFYSGTAVTPSGKDLNYSLVNPDYKSALDAGIASPGSIFALLRYQNGAWKLVTKKIGPTDVTYATWWKDYSAPKEIFPYTE